ncbi:angiopoietin-related protein 4 isoform X2 [Lampris incognitus]|uniref:angiopoietin-related protein 4 isoform X2 n=1 Tax=Lampris incognitus TaxID=2546036 RepID=UPI0024B4F471|nr:angiopoietin-related protein 4 isoform X2 [Lampris incognitus]
MPRTGRSLSSHSQLDRTREGRAVHFLLCNNRAVHRPEQTFNDAAKPAAMKTTLATLAPFLAVLVAADFPFARKGGSSASGTTKEKRVQYAAWDDVNVLAHGLLQLGQGLKEHVDKTKVQMRDISTKLKVFNGTVTELGKESQKLRAEGEALKAQVRGLEDREGHLLNITAELREKTEEMQHERRTLTERMSRLEERVDSMLQGDGVLPDMNAGASKNYSEAGIIQVMLEAQNKRIDDLVVRIRLQQEKLDKQNVRIRTLQSQLQQKKERPMMKSSNKAEDKVQTSDVEQRDSPAEIASDCHELFLRGETASGVYTIQPLNAQPFEVFCEMTAGGWTVIQRRQDGSVDFDQLWQAYQKGFGSLNGEFWLGLEKIYSVSKNGDYILKIKFSDWRDDSESIQLPFHLGGEETKYSLHIQETGTIANLESSLVTDAISGLPFSTRDQDNDQKNDINCAKHLSGGWWFSNCGRANLNGRYFQSPPPKQRHQRKQGVFWKTWRGRYYPLKTTVMMIAPASVEHKS